MTEPRLLTLPPRLLLGLRVRSSLVHDQTSPLWRRFRALAPTIGHRPDDLFYSVQVMPPGVTYATFTPTTEFEKWAAVAVTTAADQPAELEVLTLPGGLCAGFRHRGLPSAYPATARHIFGTWLPGSPYEVDDRPQFETFGPAYSPFDEAAEEDIWVPIRLRPPVD